MSGTTQLQRYQVMRPLGQGAQGSTFVAIDRQTSREVALKVLSLKGVTDWKAFERFEKEIETLKLLDHPAIPKFLDSYSSEESGEYFLVMSLTDGLPLSENVRSSVPLPAKTVRSIFVKLLDVLEYLHHQTPPVIHRDIKPANIVMTKSGDIALVDFGGIQRAFEQVVGTTVVGTFGYMAPEQLHGQTSTASDLFSLAATIAAVACGCEAEALPRSGLQITLPPAIPADLRPVLHRMLQPDPRARFASVPEVRKALEAHQHNRPTAPFPSAATQPDTPAQNAGTQKTTESVDNGVSLVPTAQDLKRTPKMALGFIWALSAIASGALVIAEALFVPIGYQIARAFSSKRNDLTAQQRRTEKRLRNQRAALRKLSDSAEKAREAKPDE